jgi:hypothetical protein
VAIIREFNSYFVECQVHLMVADSSGRFLERFHWGLARSG